MTDIRERIFETMKAISELSRDAGQAKELHVMYAANRAWRELDKAARRSPQESAAVSAASKPLPWLDAEEGDMS